MAERIPVPRLRAPVVLVHGLFGFNAFSAFGVEFIPYFRGIRHFLARPGNRVHTAALSPTGRCKRRAIQLRSFLDRTTRAEQVHIIAHSMGGLDARYMISRLGAAERVLSLTTLGTPHHGTPFADWGMSRWGCIFQPPNLPFIRPVPALEDLTTAACRLFNERITDHPQVRYFSVGGRFVGRWISPNWKLSGGIIERAEGENDGLVSLTSARHGETFDVWEGDHLSLVNWPTAQMFLHGWTDQRRGYAGILQRLADCGF